MLQGRIANSYTVLLHCTPLKSLDDYSDGHCVFSPGGGVTD